MPDGVVYLYPDSIERDAMKAHAEIEAMYEAAKKKVLWLPPCLVRRDGRVYWFLSDEIRLAWEGPES